ncbi:hypothetical protein ACWIFK_17260 [Streptomyces althioticus]|uniref:hypothetical protein n=2 Tax=Streptomyces TaxID=1883 RepID=UPI00351787F6|nr:hypothetical protein OG968_15670 [Streptomyces althioticus]
MPRGRHRHSPPLHRMLPPSAIAGVSVVCALAPWVFTQPVVLRLLAAAAAVTAIVGAVVMRHWDAQAGKRVADLTRARASDEWRFEERVAELESDLEESRELRMKLEQRLRAKRAELAGLRNEHAALLRRYAAAEAERANVLEERRVLEIEAAVPARALPPGAPAAPAAPEPEPTSPEVTADVERTEDAGQKETQDEKSSGVFSPEGSKLYLKADAALARFAAKPETDERVRPETDERAEAEAASEAEAGSEADSDAPEEPDARPSVPAARKESAPGAAKAGDAPESPAVRTTAPRGGGTPEDDGPEPTKRRRPDPAQEDEAGGQPRAAGDHERAAAPAASAAPAAHRPAGHFTVPTAVAVVPPTQPVRRPVQDDGFDFFGTKNARREALDAVQNEDLADVVGQEALALHKAEAEGRYKPAAEEPRAGQVIDLTAHDETEHIDVQGLRSAVS